MWIARRVDNTVLTIHNCPHPLENYVCYFYVCIFWNVLAIQLTEFVSEMGLESAFISHHHSVDWKLKFYLVNIIVNLKLPVLSMISATFFDRLQAKLKICTRLWKIRKSHVRYWYYITMKIPRRKFRNTNYKLIFL